ncbi:hypothetical protein [Sulfurisphaera ohwakuensis]|uniref:hypothetical protein n=1 Tax=Sulfurisphaera ohwakuensis TaxID=69656 RepID=UPI0036F37628
MENYSKEIRERASQIYSDGGILGLLKRGNKLIGIVKDIDIYRVEYDLSLNKGKCECRLGENCEHIYAIKMSYEKGEYIDFDSLENKIIGLNKRELLGILVTLIEKFPMIANYIYPIENAKYSLERYINLIKQNPGENIVNSFTDFLINNREKINKDDIFIILDTIASCKSKCFYNFITEKPYDENLMKTLANILLEKEVKEDDIKKLEKIIGKDKYGNLDTFVLILLDNEDIRKLMDIRIYLNALIRRGDKDKILKLLQTDVISKEEKFNILLQTDEKEALEFAKINMLYSSLFNYYYNLGEFSQALENLKKMIELKDIIGISNHKDKILPLIKGNPDLVKSLYELSKDNVILYPLLINLYDVASGSLKYDIAVTVMDKFLSLKDYCPDVIRIVGEQRKEKLSYIVQHLTEELVERKRYEDVIQCLKVARKYMMIEDFNNLLSQIKENYKRKRQLVSLINKYLS